MSTLSIEQLHPNVKAVIRSLAEVGEDPPQPELNDFGGVDLPQTSHSVVRLICDDGQVTVHQLVDGFSQASATFDNTDPTLVAGWILLVLNTAG